VRRAGRAATIAACSFAFGGCFLLHRSTDTGFPILGLVADPSATALQVATAAIPVGARVVVLAGVRDSAWLAGVLVRTGLRPAMRPVEGPLRIVVMGVTAPVVDTAASLSLGGRTVGLASAVYDAPGAGRLTVIALAPPAGAAATDIATGLRHYMANHAPADASTILALATDAVTADSVGGLLGASFKNIAGCAPKGGPPPLPGPSMHIFYAPRAVRCQQAHRVSGSLSGFLARLTLAGT
jgi:hypothetical protein